MKPVRFKITAIKDKFHGMACRDATIGKTYDGFISEKGEPTIDSHIMSKAQSLNFVDDVGDNVSVFTKAVEYEVVEE